ncbi:hypothetical protein H1R20_g10625, partial [Candolleomyces eurysporus]
MPGARPIDDETNSHVDDDYYHYYIASQKRVSRWISQTRRELETATPMPIENLLSDDGITGTGTGTSSGSGSKTTLASSSTLVDSTGHRHGKGKERERSSHYDRQYREKGHPESREEKEKTRKSSRKEDVAVVHDSEMPDSTQYRTYHHRDSEQQQKKKRSSSMSPPPSAYKPRVKNALELKFGFEGESTVVSTTTANGPMFETRPRKADPGSTSDLAASASDLARLRMKESPSKDPAKSAVPKSSPSKSRGRSEGERTGSERKKISADRERERAKEESAAHRSRSRATTSKRSTRSSSSPSGGYDFSSTSFQALLVLLSSSVLMIAVAPRVGLIMSVAVAAVIVVVVSMPDHDKLAQLIAPMATPKVFKVVPTTQQYDWGKLGRQAKVAQFAEASQVPGFAVDEEKPYAELWMGTHSSSPSRVKETGDLLSDYLQKNPDLIGSSIPAKFEDVKNGNLPFLFKVLSIAKALSIQSHPDKQTAEKLHAESPKIYKDPNHKPEMALALTDFEALCGFRPIQDIERNLRDTPELSALIPPTILEDFYNTAKTATPNEPPAKTALKNLFAAVMTAPTDQVHSAIESIIGRYEREAKEHPNPTTTDGGLRSLILRLQTQFPYDIGILCPYLLNILHLKPGEAIFLGAGEPHAYISGEAIECMANSDNVIRAGLTPKLRDVPNLVSGLTYVSAEGRRHYVSPAAFSAEGGEYSLVYDPPIEEFSVVKVEVPAGAKATQRAVSGPSLAIVTDGKGVVSWSESGEVRLGAGDVVFIGADTPVSFSSEGEGLMVYRAFVEV